MPEWISGAVREALKNSGWLDDQTSGPGRQDERLRDHPADLPSGVVGIDVGGTKIRAVVADPHSTTPRLVEVVTDTEPAGGFVVIEEVVALCRDLSFGPLRAVGIACPGVLDRNTGRIDHAPNLTGWSEIDVVGEIQARLGAPVVVENDVVAAASAESCVCGAHDLAFVALGTGIGLGLILNGVPRLGARGQAGEICHLPLGADPFDDRLHQHGVLESRLAGPRIFEEYRAAGGAALTLSDAFDDARDPASRDAFSSTAQLLALTVRTIRAVVDPELVVLGGGIGSRPDMISAVAAELSRTGGGAIELRRSVLGSRAAAIGALRAAYLRVDGSRTSSGGLLDNRSGPAVV